MLLLFLILSNNHYATQFLKPSVPRVSQKDMFLQKYEQLETCDAD